MSRTGGGERLPVRASRQERTITVVCENCGAESAEADMGSDCIGPSSDGDDELWSNHICPTCGFWNDTRRVWDAEVVGATRIDLRTEENDDG